MTEPADTLTAYLAEMRGLERIAAKIDTDNRLDEREQEFGRWARFFVLLTFFAGPLIGAILGWGIA